MARRPTANETITSMKRTDRKNADPTPRLVRQPPPPIWKRLTHGRRYRATPLIPLPPTSHPPLRNPTARTPLLLHLKLSDLTWTSFLTPPPTYFVSSPPFSSKSLTLTTRSVSDNGPPVLLAQARAPTRQLAVYRARRDSRARKLRRPSRAEGSMPRR